MLKGYSVPNERDRHAADERRIILPNQFHRLCITELGAQRGVIQRGLGLPVAAFAWTKLSPLRIRRSFAA
jgi:hypothetical protein